MNEKEVRSFLEDVNNISPLFPKNIVIDAIVGRGGQGIVYKGLVSGIESAIKIYFPGQVLTRIERETSALLSLDNPNIVKGLWSNTIFIDPFELPVIATTFISGVSLEDRIRSGKLSMPEIGVVGYDIANAILAMWSTRSRIVHRDLKPNNVMIKTNGRACVIDLGVARHINRTPLTTTGSTWGTDGYMSPEQTAAIKSLTSKSDIFALGVILAECAMGRHPSGYDQSGILSMKLHEKLPFELESWSHANLVKNMLHPRATKRPTPDDIMRQLQEFAL